MADPGVDFVKFQGLDVVAAALGQGRRRRRQAGGSFVHPVDDGLVVHAQMSCDAPEVGAVHIQLEGSLAAGQFVAFLVGCGRIGAVAVLALDARAAAVVLAGFVLAGGFGAGRADVRRRVHKTIFGGHRPKLDTPRRGALLTFGQHRDILS